jgi:hypothetical protein
MSDMQRMMKGKSPVEAMQDPAMMKMAMDMMKNNPSTLFHLSRISRLSRLSLASFASLASS